MEVQKIGIKIPVMGQVDRVAIQKTFMVWIQKNSLPGLLIDVADYGHMHQGPGTVLIAHEFMFSMDEQDGVCGVRVSSRLASDKPLASRIGELLDLLKTGARLLREQLGLTLDGSRLEIFALDRLNSNGQTPVVLQEALSQILTGHQVKKDNTVRDARRLPGLDLAISPALQWA